MEAAAARAGRRGRIAALACGCALAAAAVYVAADDPSAPGARFPGCVFREATGLWCPGCGLTRGMHSLLLGDIAAALSSILFTPLVALVLVAGWWTWTRAAFGGRPALLARVSSSWWVGTAVALAAYGVLRNIPLAPLRSLSP